MLLRISHAKLFSVLGALAFAAVVQADDPVTPAIPGVAAGGVVIETIKEGFKGTEGPIGYTDGSLLFTETNENRIVRIAPDNTVTSFLENSNGANGLALNANGEIIAVQTLKPQVGIIYPTDKQKLSPKILKALLFNGRTMSFLIKAAAFILPTAARVRLKKILIRRLLIRAYSTLHRAVN